MSAGVPPAAETRLLGLVDDALDLSAVNIEFAGYRALAVTRFVPGAYRLLQPCCFRQCWWFVVVRDRDGGARGYGMGRSYVRPVPCPDQGHKEFKRTGQRQGGPGADQGTDGPLAEAVRQVGTDGGDNACTEAPPRQGWCGVVPSAGIEHEHARGQDEPSTVNGTSRAVTPVSPWVLRSS
jgi:hypothetical protein